VTLAILTTNEKPDDLRKLLDMLTQKKLKYKLYYTDARAFEKALLWYDQMELQDAMIQKQQQEKATAVGQSAEKLLQDLYEQRAAMDDGKFVNEMIRLTFQS